MPIRQSHSSTLYYVTSIKFLALGLLLHVLSLQLQVEIGDFLGFDEEDVPPPRNVTESGPSEGPAWGFKSGPAREPRIPLLYSVCTYRDLCPYIEIFGLLESIFHAVMHRNIWTTFEIFRPLLLMLIIGPIGLV